MNRYYKLFLLLLVVSCSEDKIPESDLSKIIADFYIADGYLNTNYQIVQKMDSVSLYAPIIKKYGYTISEFNSTISKLIERPSTLKKVFEESKKIIDLQRVDIENKINQENKRGIFLPELFKAITQINKGEKVSTRLRSIRWIAFPNEYISFKFYDDSLMREKFEDPSLSKWWISSLKQERIDPTFISKTTRDEKNKGKESSDFNW